MNLGGHIAVARQLSTDPMVWLGAALPDVGAMGRFNLLGEQPIGSIAEGIALHHATDDVFHSHEWFKGHQSTLFGRLTAAGIRRGAARAVAHVGPELLLDGELLTNSGIKRDVNLGMGQLAAHLDAVELLVQPAKRTGWRTHLEHVVQRPAPSYFDDPYAVAQMLERILRNRPRLALDSEQVSKVGEILDEAHESIVSSSHGLVDDLAQMLSD
jgi:hypothetical protein